MISAGGLWRKKRRRGGETKGEEEEVSLKTSLSAFLPLFASFLSLLSLSLSIPLSLWSAHIDHFNNHTRKAFNTPAARLSNLSLPDTLSVSPFPPPPTAPFPPSAPSPPPAATGGRLPSTRRSRSSRAWTLTSWRKSRRWPRWLRQWPSARRPHAGATSPTTTARRRTTPRPQRPTTPMQRTP